MSDIGANWEAFEACLFNAAGRGATD